MLFNFHTKLSLHWLLHVLSVLNKVLCVDYWVLLFWVSTWFIVVCSQVGVWWNVVCSVYVLLLDWLMHVFMSKWSSSLLLPCFCNVFVGAVISANAAATTTAVIVATKDDSVAIVAILFALPSMPLLLSYLCHNTNTSNCCCCHTSWLLCLGDVIGWVGVDLSVNVVLRESVNDSSIIFGTKAHKWSINY